MPVCHLHKKDTHVPTSLIRDTHCLISLAGNNGEASPPRQLLRPPSSWMQRLCVRTDHHPGKESFSRILAFSPPRNSPAHQFARPCQVYFPSARVNLVRHPPCRGIERHSRLTWRLFCSLCWFSCQILHTSVDQPYSNVPGSGSSTRLTSPPTYSENHLPPARAWLYLPASILVRNHRKLDTRPSFLC